MCLNVLIFMAIADNNWGYSILRRYVIGLYPLAYSRLVCKGVENIPSDGAVIFAPNHTNALMDALTVLAMADRTTVFVARADIFKNKYIAKLLYFFKLMPIMRMRDGRENLKKNEEIIRKAVEVLEAGVPFCIFCEGTHRMKHSLLPIVKGIFRIAFRCNDELKGDKPVYIVPVGIEYGSYTRYRNSLSINVGKAIDVTGFIGDSDDASMPELMVKLKTELAREMVKLFHYVPDDENYDALLDLSYIRTGRALARGDIKPNPYSVMMENRQTVEKMTMMETENPALFHKTLDIMSRFAILRRKSNISDESLYRANMKVYFLPKILLLLSLLPYALWCTVVSAPLLAMSEVMVCRLTDKAFSNSLRFVFAVLLMPLIAILLYVILSGCMPYWAFAISMVSLPAHIVVHDYVKAIRIMVSDYRLRHSEELQTLLKLLSEIFIS